MADLDKLKQALLGDLYGVGFTSTNTVDQNFNLMVKTAVTNALKQSISSNDLISILNVTEVKDLTTTFRDDYQILMFPIFEQDSISRVAGIDQDHRLISGSMGKVQEIITVLGLGVSLAAFNIFITESKFVFELTGVGSVRKGDISEAMADLAISNAGW